MIDHLKRHPKSGLGFIYFDYTEALTVQEIITSLLEQLVNQHSSMPALLLSQYNIWAKTERKDRPSDETFVELLIQCISEFPRVFIILDAFDEMKEEERLELIERLQLFCNSKVNLFITTRSPHAGFLGQSFPKSAELKITAQDSDIHEYLSARLRTQPLDPKLKALISTTLQNNAQGK